MAYCFNPVCPQPQNKEDVNFCQACGTSLTLAGAYKSQSLLGKGGFGRTFLAKVVSTAVESGNESQLQRRSTAEPVGNFCVIKQIYGASAATQARFQSEAKRLKQLGKHPQIPRLIAAIENSLGQFLVQEFAPGKTLEQQVEQGGTWDEKRARSLLNSLIPVLQYVHSFKVIHRDIKPANIVERSRQDNRQTDTDSLMLVDFGAAKWIGQTAAKTVIGSAGYAAPEQSMGQAVFASDIYSLGLTCIHLLTGMHPFELYSAAEDRWVWQDYLTQPVLPQLAQVLDKMVARSLQERYQTMDAVAVDLEASLKASVRSQLSGARQLLERAKDSVSPLQNVLKGESLTDALRQLVPEQSPQLSQAPVIIDPQRWEIQHRIAVPMGLTQAIAINPRTPIFATASSDGAIRLWDLFQGQLLHTFTRRRFGKDGHSATVTDVQFHPDGRALYSASDDSTIKEWDSQGYELMNTLSSNGWTPTAIAISADGTTLISANSDGRIVLWDIATLKPIGQLSQHQQRVNAIALSSSNDLLVSTGEDATLRLWNYQSGQIPRLSKTIRVESQEGRFANLQSFGGFTDTKKGAIVAIFQTPSEPDSSHQYLVTATRSTIWRYELTPQCEVGNPTALYQSPHSIRAIALSQTGTLAVGTEDRVLTLWELSTGNCVGELKHDWGVSAIAFSPDGQTLVSASADETLFIWRKKP